MVRLWLLELLQVRLSVSRARVLAKLSQWTSLPQRARGLLKGFPTRAHVEISDTPWEALRCVHPGSVPLLAIAFFDGDNLYALPNERIHPLCGDYEEALWIALEQVDNACKLDQTQCQLYVHI